MSQKQCAETQMNSNDLTKSANDPRPAAIPAQNPASQPHGTTQDQANEMESEGQAMKQGQNPLPARSQVTQMPRQKDEKRKTS